MNYSEEQIKKALRQFIDDPETAKRFAAAMREGLEDKEPDEAELETINEQLIDIMQRNGFEDISTGGGCEAWSKNVLPDGSIYLLVTVGADSLTYQELAEVHQSQITICAYAKDSEWLEASQQYLTWEEFKAAMKEGK
jgi:hypothetical protein